MSAHLPYPDFLSHQISITFRAELLNDWNSEEPGVSFRLRGWLFRDEIRRHNFPLDIVRFWNYFALRAAESHLLSHLLLKPFQQSLHPWMNDFLKYSDLLKQLFSLTQWEFKPVLLVQKRKHDITVPVCNRHFIISNTSNNQTHIWASSEIAMTMLAYTFFVSMPSV